MKIALTFTTALGLLGTAAGQASNLSCGAKSTCPEDSFCLPTRATCLDLKRCPGQCWFKNQYPSCGGFVVSPRGCRRTHECVKDPRKKMVITDQPGICLPKDRSTLPSCGGFAGRACPEGTYCYDNPWDSCDPKRGADCSGICL